MICAEAFPTPAKTRGPFASRLDIIYAIPRRRNPLVVGVGFVPSPLEGEGRVRGDVFLACPHGMAATEGKDYKEHPHPTLSHQQRERENKGIPSTKG
jgi:hypothetical protein